MFWVILCVLCLANLSKCDTVSSVPDAVRLGATLISRFINSNPPNAFSLIFNRITNEIKMNKTDGNTFVLFVLRMMGVDNQKITNFAFDGFISVVRLMNQILIQNSGRKKKERMGFSLFRFILTQPQVSNLIIQMQDPNLMDQIMKQSEEQLKYYPEENVDCIKVLICWTKPFVKQMQKSLKFFIKRENIISEEREKQKEEETCRREEEEEEEVAAWEKANMEERMYFFVPGFKEVIQWGDHCHYLFPNCIY